jgi:hypothetical protein
MKHKKTTANSMENFADFLIKIFFEKQRKVIKSYLPDLAFNRVRLHHKRNNVFTF